MLYFNKKNLHYTKNRILVIIIPNPTPPMIPVIKRSLLLLSLKVKYWVIPSPRVGIINNNPAKNRVKLNPQLKISRIMI